MRGPRAGPATAAAVALGATAVVLAPGPVHACGALVCSGGPGGTIDQANERVLFVLEEDEAGPILTAAIQIQYAGLAVDFAWILPVPAVPESIDVAAPDLFAELDAATAPVFRLPAPPMEPSSGEVGSFTPRCGPPMVGITGDPSGTASEEFASDGVTVWGTGTVGPYDLAVISAPEPDPLIEWVERHGYAASGPLIERAEVYVKEGFKFVVLRLAPEAGADAIAPLVVRYRGATPCVPLRLTAFAALPEMSVRVYVAAPARALPLNYAALAPDYQELVNGWFVSDYESLVARAANAAGGHGWITEYAGPVGGAILNAATGRRVTSPEMLALLGRGAYLTRLYTRISPEEMDVDPLFLLEPGGANVDNLHPLAPEPLEAAATGGAAGALCALALGATALARTRRHLRSGA